MGGSTGKAENVRKKVQEVELGHSNPDNAVKEAKDQLTKASAEGLASVLRPGAGEDTIDVDDPVDVEGLLDDEDEVDLEAAMRATDGLSYFDNEDKRDKVYKFNRAQQSKAMRAIKWATLQKDLDDATISKQPLEANRERSEPSQEELRELRAA